MNKRELSLLEKAFAAEIRGALHGALPLMQTRSKLVAKLVADGMLEERTERLGGRFPMTISGYALTELGRYTYCASCKEEKET